MRRFAPRLSAFAREYRGLALFAVLLVVFRGALADWNDVPTGSMRPTIVEGDRILVDNLAYDLRVPLTHISLHGFVPRDEILGRSRTVVVSLDHDRWLLPRGDRFLKGL